MKFEYFKMFRFNNYTYLINNNIYKHLIMQRYLYCDIGTLQFI